MIYHLSDKFNNNIGINNNISLINSGFSGRSLFELIKSYSQYIGQFCIPPILSEEKIIVLSVVPDSYNLYKILQDLSINFEEWKYQKNFYKKWYKDISSVLLLIHNNISVYTKGRGYKEFNDIKDALKFIIDYFNESQDGFYLYNKKILENKLSEYEEFICDDCFNKGYYGKLELEKSQYCNKCGKLINSSFFTFDKNNRFY